MNGQINANVMERLGLDALLEYMDMDKEELLEFMIKENCPTIVELAAVLDEFTSLCTGCYDKYIDQTSILCTDCEDVRWSRF